MARSVMLKAGWEPGELTDEMLGTSWWECIDPLPSTCTCHPELGPRIGLHYYDAVGDLALINEKWGPSLTAFQIRTLRDPTAWGRDDVWRDAEKLHDDPIYAAKAARVIVGPNGEHRDYWTMWRNGRYLEHKGEDFELHAGHIRAHLWNS
jgi:hypothetical protein